MGPMSSSLATSLILPPRDGQLVGAALGAEATATTYLIHGCRTEIEDLKSCDGSTGTLTLGPWARSSADAAITGVYDAFDVFEYDGETFMYSEHCEMTGIVARVCTVIDEGAIEDPISETFRNEDGEEDERLIFAPYPIIITEGLELLAATHSTSHKATATGDTDSDAAKATASEQTPAESPASETKASGSAPAPEETSAGVSRSPCMLAAFFAVLTATAVLG
ncbi:hypothetical protein ACHAPT_010936 [Fusarium lateritium]